MSARLITSSEGGVPVNMGNLWLSGATGLEYRLLTEDERMYAEMQGRLISGGPTLWRGSIKLVQQL